jgi:hypothetical protein
MVLTVPFLTAASKLLANFSIRIPDSPRAFYFVSVTHQQTSLTYKYHQVHPSLVIRGSMTVESVGHLKSTVI